MYIYVLLLSYDLVVYGMCACNFLRLIFLKICYFVWKKLIKYKFNLYGYKLNLYFLNPMLAKLAE